jgi:hypothetical protein
MTDTSQPYSIAIWGDELKNVHYSDEAFEPLGSWTSLYSVYYLLPFTKPWRSAFRSWGALRIERTAVSTGESQLKGVRLNRMVCGNFARLSWNAGCATDRLSTPKQWQVESQLMSETFSPITKDGYHYLDISTAGHLDRSIPMQAARFSFNGLMDDSHIEISGLTKRSWPVQATTTANWCLFDALQRLAGEEISPIRFDLLEDYETVKSGQVLSYYRTCTVEFANTSVKLNGYKQLGHGILPWEYWLDEKHRLVMAAGGFLGYLLNPNEDYGRRI